MASVLARPGGSEPLESGIVVRIHACLGRWHEGLGKSRLKSGDAELILTRAAHSLVLVFRRQSVLGCRSDFGSNAHL
jgi:hypothetical protein